MSAPMAEPASVAFLNLIRDVLDQGTDASPRLTATREILGHVTEINMIGPIVQIPERKLSYRFMAAEALWILSGSRSLGFHEQIARKLGRFSDDGWTMSGAYGPPFVSQYRYIVEALAADNETRQAVATLWLPNPRPSKDIPCTIFVQFILRGGLIHMNVGMRSSDAWMGWPYDVFSFTMMATFIGLHLRRLKPIIYELGTLRIFAGSQHLYGNDMPVARVLSDEYRSKSCEDIKFMFLSRHLGPDGLLAELRGIADGQVEMF